MTDFNRIKKLLSGSTTMPQGTAMGGHNNNSHVHYHDGVACTHDHSKDHDHGHDHANHNHHSDGTCCDEEKNCAHKDHK